MNIEKTIHILNENLHLHLRSVLPKHVISDVYQYAVFPPGKLFRPLMVCAIANDLDEKLDISSGSPHANLASAIEFHHAYTLIHDDLPCMDDDSMRRDKPSTHIAFGEWKALLAGDGLLNASYQMISKINSKNLPLILKIFSKALGPQGLIHGQVLDLSEEMNKSFLLLKQTHEYKTARLIQTAMLNSYLLTSSPKYRTAIDVCKLGLHIGLIFQFLDDLTELTDQDVSDHESSINPWINYPSESYAEIMGRLEKTKSILDKYKLNSTAQILNNYFQKIFKKLDGNFKNIELNLSVSADEKNNLKSLVSFLKTFSN